MLASSGDGDITITIILIIIIITTTLLLCYVAIVIVIHTVASFSWALPDHWLMMHTAGNEKSLTLHTETCSCTYVCVCQPPHVWYYTVTVFITDLSESVCRTAIVNVKFNDKTEYFTHIVLSLLVGSKNINQHIYYW